MEKGRKVFLHRDPLKTSALNEVFLSLVLLRLKWSESVSRIGKPFSLFPGSATFEVERERVTSRKTFLPFLNKKPPATPRVYVIS